MYIKNIADNLGILSKQVEIRNSINLYDINILAEDFYSGLLNIIFGTNYVNVNTVEKNEAAIDLVDDSNKKAVQVISDNTSRKIKHTIDEFILNEDFKKYDELKILILTKKANYKTQFDTQGKFMFDKAKDIVDVNDLICYIRSLGIEKLKQINDYLQKEVYDKYEATTRTEASEVDTIMDLIEFISKNKRVIAPKDVVIDPEFKIYNRFKKFAQSITLQYKDY